MAEENGAVQNSENESEDERLEREHFSKVVNAFLHYQKYSNLRIEKARKDFLSLAPKDQQRLPQFLDNLEIQKDAVAKNFEFLKKIIGNTVQSYLLCQTILATANGQSCTPVTVLPTNEVLEVQ